MRDYEAAIASNRADTKAVTDLCEVDVGPPPIAFADIFSSQIDPRPYYITPDIGVSVDKYPELSLFKQADTGVDLSGKNFPEYDIRNDEKATSKTINEGGYDKGGTFIVANIAFKGNDQKAKDDPSRVPNNDMTWQAFAKAATKNNVKNLKVIYLRDVQNAGMWAITQTNYSERKIDLSTIEVWDASTPQGEIWFNRFLGSDNVSGKILTLTNHHQALGNKKILKIITIPKQATSGTSSKYTAALVLG